MQPHYYTWDYSSSITSSQTQFVLHSFSALRQEGHVTGKDCSNHTLRHDLNQAFYITSSQTQFVLHCTTNYSLWPKTHFFALYYIYKILYFSLCIKKKKWVFGQNCTTNHKLHTFSLHMYIKSLLFVLQILPTFENKNGHLPTFFGQNGYL